MHILRFILVQGIEGLKTFPAEALLGQCPIVGRGFSREAMCGPITSTILSQTFWIQNLGITHGLVVSDKLLNLSGSSTV